MIELTDHEPLRPAVTEVAASVVQAWRAESGFSPVAFQPALAVGADAEAAEIGQGFTVMSDGRVRSTFDAAGEPFGDLLRAYELGLVGGDPRQVQVWRMPPAAGLGGAAWDMFTEAVKVLEILGATYAGVDVIGKGIRAFRRAVDILVRHKSELEEGVSAAGRAAPRQSPPLDDNGARAGPRGLMRISGRRRRRMRGLGGRGGC